MTYLQPKPGNSAVTEVHVTSAGGMVGYITSFLGTYTGHLDDHVPLGSRRTLAEAHALVDAALAADDQLIREHNARILAAITELDAATAAA